MAFLSSAAVKLGPSLASVAALAAWGCLASACGSSVDVFSQGTATGSGGGAQSSTGVAVGGSGPDTSSSVGSPTSSSAVTVASSSSTGGCNPGPNDDYDADGFSLVQGDCNDCDALINPGAIDYAGNGLDDECNGTLDDPSPPCDAALALDSPDPMDGARAIGLCRMANEVSWGVKQATYVTSDGQPLANYDPKGTGHGILAGFGPNVHPQEGSKVLVLSSGSARQPSDPDFVDHAGNDKGYMTGAPPGFPQDSPTCPNAPSGSPHDSAGLLVTLRAPTNAKSITFEFDFYAFDFPAFVCSQYADAFVAIMNPPPLGGINGNAAPDPTGDIMSLNGATFSVCAPNTMAGGKLFPCPLGTAELLGTGYADRGATGWLQAHAGIQPGQDVTILFTIWDAGDGIEDSSVVLDDVVFHPEDIAVGTTVVAMPL